MQGTNPFRSTKLAPNSNLGYPPPYEPITHGDNEATGYPPSGSSYGNPGAVQQPVLSSQPSYAGNEATGYPLPGSPYGTPGVDHRPGVWSSYTQDEASGYPLPGSPYSTSGVVPHPGSLSQPSSGSPYRNSGVIQQPGLSSHPSHASSPYHPSPYPSQNESVRQGPTPAQGQGFSLSSISKLFSGQSSNPLDPPPPSFTRPVPQYVVHERFPMMVAYGLGKELRDGFTDIPPPCMAQPHPFATHDVQEADWIRFLKDIKAAAQLTMRENISSAVLPMTMNLGLTGMLVSKGIQKRQIRKKQEPVGQLVDMWNNYFFRPRRMEVILAKGDMRLTEHMETPPPDLRHDSSDDSSSNDSEVEMDDRRVLGGGSGRRARRHAKRDAKRERRQDPGTRRRDGGARRAERKIQKANKKEKYRLVLVPV